MDLDSKKYNYNIKLLIIGDRSVGKSSILDRFSSNEFYQYPKPTMGVDIYTHEISKDKHLQIYDCSGSNRFRSILSPFYKSVDGIILVYSIESQSSFVGIKNWFQLVSKHCQNENIQLLLIGNKSDLQEERCVEYEEGKELSEKLECAFFETSAKNDVNIKESFTKICDGVVKCYNASYYYKKDSIWIKRKKNVNIHIDRQQDENNIGWVYSVGSFGKRLISCFT